MTTTLAPEAPTPTTVGPHGAAYPVWHCSNCQRANDGLRHTCRYCHTHRPCDHVTGGHTCGATPTGMYTHGPKCPDHAPTGAQAGRGVRVHLQRRAAGDTLWAASRLGILTHELGRCARCGQHCHRYGDGGGPLCAGCQAGGT